MRLFVFLPDQPFPNNQIQRKSEATVEIEFIVQNWHLFLALVVIVFLLSWDSAKRRFSGVKGVGATELPQLLNHEDAAVIDIRESAEFRKGHIPGAVNLFHGDNLGDDGLHRPLAELAERFAGVGEAPIVYCGSGVTACHDLLAMSLVGVNQARLYPGSWSEWSSDPDREIATGD